MATRIYTLSELRDEQAILNGRYYEARPVPAGLGLDGSATFRRVRRRPMWQWLVLLGFVVFCIALNF